MNFQLFKRKFLIFSCYDLIFSCPEKDRKMTNRYPCGLEAEVLHGRTELAWPGLPDLLHACESGSVELFGPVHTSIVKSTMAFAIQVIKLYASL